jgi:ATP-dependent DNA ligase
VSSRFDKCDFSERRSVFTLPASSNRVFPHPPIARHGAGHEIKHDGFSLLACRDVVGIRLLTRNGNDITGRYPLIIEALAALPVRSCIIDGEGGGV